MTTQLRFTELVNGNFRVWNLSWAPLRFRILTPEQMGALVAHVNNFDIDVSLEEIRLRAHKGERSTDPRTSPYI